MVPPLLTVLLLGNPSPATLIPVNSMYLPPPKARMGEQLVSHSAIFGEKTIFFGCWRRRVPHEGDCRYSCPGRGACAKALELAENLESLRTNKRSVTEPGEFGGELDEMRLQWAGSGPQIPVLVGARQEDEAGGCGMWPPGAHPPPGRLAASPQLLLGAAS